MGIRTATRTLRADDPDWEQCPYFCDGIVIAAAFLTDLRVGIATTVAIVAYAVPEQIGYFAGLIIPA